MRSAVISRQQGVALLLVALNLASGVGAMTVGLAPAVGTASAPSLNIAGKCVYFVRHGQARALPACIRPSAQDPGGGNPPEPNNRIAFIGGHVINASCPPLLYIINTSWPPTDVERDAEYFPSGQASQDRTCGPVESGRTRNLTPRTPPSHTARRQSTTSCSSRTARQKGACCSTRRSLRSGGTRRPLSARTLWYLFFFILWSLIASLVDRLALPSLGLTERLFLSRRSGFWETRRSLRSGSRLPPSTSPGR